jgi:hypothetical protein
MVAAGLAQDRDVAARGPLGHVELRRELAAGDARLGLQQFEGPKRPCRGAQVGIHVSTLIRKPTVRNRVYRRDVATRKDGVSD